MAKGLPVRRVVNVAVNLAAKAAGKRNFGTLMILGDSDIIDAEERIRDYTAAEDVAADFGANSPEYRAAKTFYSQSPTPLNVKIGRWLATSSKGLLKGRILGTAEQALSKFTAISTGSLVIKVDGTDQTANNINLSTALNLNNVASLLQTAFTGKLTVKWDGTRFVFTSLTSGTSSTVTTIDKGSLAQVLGLGEGTKSVAGAQQESLADCIALMLDKGRSWYCLHLATTQALTDDDFIAVAGSIESASDAHLFGLTITKTNVLDGTDSEDLGSKLKGKGYNRTFAVYSSDNKHADCSVFGRFATINYEGVNTTITAKFKQCPDVTPEELTTSQANTLEAKHVNVFVTYDNDTAILQEGVMCGGNFIDEMTGLDWLQDKVQTAVYNVLYTSTTKIPQTDSGIQRIVAKITQCLDAGVKNGLIAPGVWGGDPLGIVETGDFLPNGYYVYAQSVNDQDQADRESRKAPPITCLIKLAGAVHFVDVAINVYR